MIRPVGSRQLLAEATGAMFLLVGVVGSGIMAERLSPGDTGLQLFQNAAATAAVLVAVISIFGTISADFNPAITIGAWALGHRAGRDVLPMVLAQTVGACCGTVLANLMFDLPAVAWATTERTGANLWLAEVVATVGLLLVVFSLVRTARTSQLPYAVGAYVGGAYYFTSSTGFANPAVTVARTLSDTFTGIDPTCAPMFILMQVAGAGVAVGLLRVLFPTTE
ncbi:MAG: aquaporin [Actinobacteria bacterium]|nr:aquaporin [Actinomycetota bacterium]MBT5568597.1 aquaporin family protein [Acidimicrobiaceae bacterium]